MEAYAKALNFAIPTFMLLILVEQLVARKMDAWGVEGCSLPENHAWIVDRLTANAEKYSWRDTITAATNLASHPSLWSAHFLIRMAVGGWIDALIEEAIRRAACVESAKL